MKKIALTMLPVALTLTLMVGCAPNGGKSGGEITNPVIDNIMARRSVRAYKAVPVGRDTMNVILKCGINAPNAMNSQNWEVRVLDNADEIAAVTKIFAEANPDQAARPGFVNMFRNAPTVAFVAHKADAGMSQIDCGLLGEKHDARCPVVGHWHMLPRRSCTVLDRFVPGFPEETRLLGRLRTALRHRFRLS